MSLASSWHREQSSAIVAGTDQPRSNFVYYAESPQRRRRKPPPKRGEKYTGSTISGFSLVHSARLAVNEGKPDLRLRGELRGQAEEGRLEVRTRRAPETDSRHGQRQ